MPGLQRAYQKSLPLRVFVDFFLTYGVVILMLEYSESVEIITMAGAVLLVVIYYTQGVKNKILINMFSTPSPVPNFQIIQKEVRGKKSFRVLFKVTKVAKAAVIMLTCVAIMGCDFPLLFPKAHIKTEEYGLSLMDIGVGCCMFVSGLGNKLTVQHASASRLRPLLKELQGALTDNVIVTIAACIRYFLLTGIDYHDHVTEWGVHWNFYATIAAVNIILAFFRQNKFALETGLCVLVVQEVYI